MNEKKKMVGEWRKWVIKKKKMEKGKWKDKENSTNSLKKLNAKRYYGKIEEIFLICGREN